MTVDSASVTDDEFAMELDVDFNEQGTFPLTPTVKLEMGDVVTTTCTYDNPGDTAVTFGENTGNEMCFNFAVYYPMGSMACGSGTFAGGLRGN